MFKISKRHKEKSKAENDIKHIRDALKKEPLVLKKLKEYGIDKSLIDNVSIQFDTNLDVSAKTVNGKIYLNAEMLKKDWRDYFSYPCHEIVHVLQHLTNKCNGQHEDGNYLDNPAEIEAFQTQIKVREKTEPKEDVVEYVEDLMDKHDIPSDERSAKKRELLGN